MHAGYALVVGVSLLRFAGRRSVRDAGLLYPPFVLLFIVATGNHFFFDAVAGAALASVAFLLAAAIGRPQPTS
jgi:PAP2 superfamily